MEQKLTPGECLEWLQRLYAKVPQYRVLWKRLAPEDVAPGFCIHLGDDFYPMLTCVIDVNPINYRVAYGLEFDFHIDPAGERSSYSRRFPKNLADALVALDYIQDQARDFISKRAKIVPGARVLIDGEEMTVSRIYLNPTNPNKHRRQVAVEGSRRRYPFSQVSPLKEISNG